MLAAQLWGAESLGLADLAEPELSAENQLVIEVSACGICGSDLHNYRSPTHAPSGRVLGHEFSGRVVSARQVAGVNVGDRIVVRPQIPCHECAMCTAGHFHLCLRGPAGIVGYGYDGGFAERALIPRATLNETVYLLPDAVEDRGGALVEPLAVGLHAVKQAGDVAGSVVLVLGAGTIGLATTQFLRLRGAGMVIVADPSELRRNAASLLGADLVVDPTVQATSRAISRAAVRGPGPGWVDVVIDCAGASPALDDALRALRPLGTLVICATYGTQVPIAPDWIVGKELQVRGSFAYLEEFPEVIAALAAGHVDPSQFISHELPLTDIAQAFRTQLDPTGSLKVLVRPDGHPGRRIALRG